MKTKHVIGQKIVAVQQAVKSTGRPFEDKCNQLEYIELENGCRLYPLTIETDHGDYAHDISVVKPQAAKSAKKRKKKEARLAQAKLIYNEVSQVGFCRLKLGEEIVRLRKELGE